MKTRFSFACLAPRVFVNGSLVFLGIRNPRTNTYTALGGAIKVDSDSTTFLQSIKAEMEGDGTDLRFTVNFFHEDRVRNFFIRPQLSFLRENMMRELIEELCHERRILSEDEVRSIELQYKRRHINVSFKQGYSVTRTFEVFVAYPPQGIVRKMLASEYLCIIPDTTAEQARYSSMPVSIRGMSVGTNFIK